MTEPTRIGEGFRRAAEDLARVWIKRHHPRCDWCRCQLETVEDDLRPFVEFCMNLGQLIPAGHRLPPAKVFCSTCAPGAISELIDGIKFIVGNSTLHA